MVRFWCLLGSTVLGHESNGGNPHYTRSSLLKRGFTGKTHRAAQNINRCHLFVSSRRSVASLGDSSARRNLVGGITELAGLVRRSLAVRLRVSSFSFRRSPGANGPPAIRRHPSRARGSHNSVSVRHLGLAILAEPAARGGFYLPSSCSPCCCTCVLRGRTLPAAQESFHACKVCFLPVLALLARPRSDLRRPIL